MPVVAFAILGPAALALDLSPTPLMRLTDVFLGRPGAMKKKFSITMWSLTRDLVPTRFLPRSFLGISVLLRAKNFLSLNPER
jgi:hypothetical protein